MNVTLEELQRFRKDSGDAHKPVRFLRREAPLFLSPMKCSRRDRHKLSDIRHRERRILFEARKCLEWQTLSNQHYDLDWVEHLQSEERHDRIGSRMAGLRSMPKG